MRLCKALGSSLLRTLLRTLLSNHACRNDKYKTEAAPLRRELCMIDRLPGGHGLRLQVYIVSETKCLAAGRRHRLDCSAMLLLVYV